MTNVPGLPIGATAVNLPTLSVSAPAVAVSLAADGALAVPDNPSMVGWWMPQPSVLVIDGHVDMAATGPGALFELQTLRPGAALSIRASDGQVEHWRIDGLRTYLKGHLPSQLFDHAGPRLIIVTCGGPFDYRTHHYADNVVAYASLA